MPTAHVTAPTDTAPEFARTLVGEGQAACLNRFDCDSVYRWEGEGHAEPETVLLAKTTVDRFAALSDRGAALHPHDVPCIERFDEDDVLAAFAAWRAEATAGGDVRSA
jgi:periplasmic divalent cation tolerance protein